MYKTIKCSNKESGQPLLLCVCVCVFQPQGELNQDILELIWKSSRKNSGLEIKCELKLKEQTRKITTKCKPITSETKLENFHKTWISSARNRSSMSVDLWVDERAKKKV